MQDPNTFKIKNGVLTKYTGKGGVVVIPDGVTKIRSGVFDFWPSLKFTSLTIPDSVVEIDNRSFDEILPHTINASENVLILLWESIDSYYDIHSLRINVAMAFLRIKRLYKPVRQFINKKKKRVLQEILRSDDPEVMAGYLEFFKTTVGDLDDFLAQTGDSPQIKAFLLAYKNEHYSAAQLAEYYEDQADKLMGEKPRTLSELRKLFKIVLRSGTAYITGYRSNETAVTIPGTIEGKPVYICGAAFRNKRFLQAVEILDGATGIGGRAFYGCTQLSTVIIPDTIDSVGDGAFHNTAFMKDKRNWQNDVLYLGNCLIKADRKLSGVYTVREGTKCIAGGAFRDCARLTGIDIPDGTLSIGECAFSDCTGLTGVTIPAGVTTICCAVFKGCTNLQCVDLPDGVTSIEGNQIIGGAFAGCTSLQSIRIPAGVTKIGADAFAACTSLKSIAIPDGVTQIGLYAFTNCTSLKELVVPASVTQIDSGAFSDCSNLESLTILGELAAYELDSLEWLIYNSPKLTLHVPAGSSVMKEAKKKGIPCVEDA